MLLNLCRPEELKRAKDGNLPLVIPAGNVEYHGPHCPVGCDTLIAEGIAARLERESEIVVAPAMAYGPSSYAASGPEQGTLHTDTDDFGRHVRGVFAALIEGGWRNVYVLIHHQYDRELLFPMTLCYMEAAALALFEFQERTRGRGWYARCGGDPDALAYKNWIKVLPVMSAEVQQRTGYDHAGRYECSLLMALYPELELVRPALAAGAREWFAKSAAEASAALGERMIRDILEDLSGKIR